MKNHLLLLLALVALVPLRAEQFFLNPDFSQGSTGWSGNFQTANSGGSAGGLVIQLKPHEWTSLSQEAAIKTDQLEIHVQMTMSADATYSTDPGDYGDFSAQIGLPEHSREVSGLKGQARGNLQGRFAILVMSPGTHGQYVSIPAKWGSPKSQGAIGGFHMGSQGTTQKIIIALPPGSGTVTFTNISANGPENEAPPELSLSEEFTGEKTLTVLPPAPQDDLIKNADFHEELNNWKGDLHPFSQFPAGGMPNFPPVAPPPQTGAYFELRSTKWVKATQVFDLSTPSYIVTVIYACSSDLEYSKHSSDYENIRTSANMTGFARGREGDWAIFTEEPEDIGVFFCPVNFPPPLDGAKMSMKRVRISGPANGSTAKLRRRQVTVAFPPGKGMVMIYRISVHPSTSGSAN